MWLAWLRAACVRWDHFRKPDWSRVHSMHYFAEFKNESDLPVLSSVFRKLTYRKSFIQPNFSTSLIMCNSFWFYFSDKSRNKHALRFLSLLCQFTYAPAWNTLWRLLPTSVVPLWAHINELQTYSLLRAGSICEPTLSYKHWIPISSNLSRSDLLCKLTHLNTINERRNSFSRPS